MHFLFVFAVSFYVLCSDHQAFYGAEGIHFICIIDAYIEKQLYLGNNTRNAFHLHNSHGN